MDAYVSHLATRLPETQTDRWIHHNLIYHESKGMYVINVINQSDEWTMRTMQEISEAAAQELFVIIIQHTKDFKDYSRPYHWATANPKANATLQLKRKRYNYSSLSSLTHLAHSHTLRMENSRNPRRPHSWVSTFHYMPGSDSISPSPSPIYYMEEHPDKDTGVLLEYKHCRLFEWTCGPFSGAPPDGGRQETTSFLSTLL